MASQLMQQLSTEKVRLAATAGDLVRARPRWRRKPAAQLTVLQVSGYIRTLDKDLAAFADELLAQAREAEAAAAAAQAQRYDLGPPAGVRGLGSRAAPHCADARAPADAGGAHGRRGCIRHAQPAHPCAASHIQRSPRGVPARDGGNARTAAIPAAAAAVSPAARERQPGAKVRSPAVQTAEPATDALAATSGGGRLPPATRWPPTPPRAAKTGLSPLSLA